MNSLQNLLFFFFHWCQVTFVCFLGMFVVNFFPSSISVKFEWMDSFYMLKCHFNIFKTVINCMVFPALDNFASVYNWISLSKHVCSEVFTLQSAGFTPRCVPQISNKTNIYIFLRISPRLYRIQIHCDS